MLHVFGGKVYQDLTDQSLPKWLGNWEFFSLKNLSICLFKKMGHTKINLLIIYLFSPQSTVFTGRNIKLLSLEHGEKVTQGKTEG